MCDQNTLLKNICQCGTFSYIIRIIFIKNKLENEIKMIEEKEKMMYVQETILLEFGLFSTIIMIIQRINQRMK